jgi:hypothetical protein
VAGGTDGEALLQIADQLCAELGYAGGEAELAGSPSPFGANSSFAMGLPSPEEESLVARLKLGLAKVAEAAGAAQLQGTPRRAVSVALDGAELVMRGELARGNAGRLPTLMPSFVFLVTLPIVDQAEALGLSRRTSELIEETGGA